MNIGVIAGAQLSAAPGGGASYGWAPTDVTGLLFWLRSDVGVTLIGGGTGTEVDTVADQSGNGLDTLVEDDGGGERVRVFNDATAGFNEIRLDAGGSGWARLRFTDASPFSGVTAAHIFASLRLLADPPASQAQSGLWNFSPQDFDSVIWTSDGHIYDGFGGASRKDFGDPTPALTTWRQIDVQNQSGASGFQWWIDGTQQGSSQTGDGSQWRASCWFGRSESAAPTFTFAGAFFDLFMYDHVLTGTDLTDARDYVAARIDGSWTAAGGD